MNTTNYYDVTTSEIEEMFGLKLYTEYHKQSLVLSDRRRFQMTEEDIFYTITSIVGITVGLLCYKHIYKKWKPKKQHRAEHWRDQGGVFPLSRELSQENYGFL